MDGGSINASFVCLTNKPLFATGKRYDAISRQSLSVEKYGARSISKNDALIELH